MEAVSVESLSMTYRAPVREAGLGAALRSLVRRRFREVEAVREITFSLEPGEVVGFIGPNGAGKTTTLKILCGVLHPTAGTARVLGHTPWRRERAFLRQIAMIRGSRPLGAPPELTVLDALRFQRLIYEVPHDVFRRSLAQLADMLSLEPLLNRQVRALSLGERMRAGLAWSLLYRPRVLFLDEPTIGLDVAAGAAVRRFLVEYSTQTRATVLLTSHYMADVESLCRRTILIDRGSLVYDGALQDLSARLAPYKLLTVQLGDGCSPRWPAYGEVNSAEGGRVSLRVRRENVPHVTARLLAELPVLDLTVEEPPLESVIARVYRDGIAL